MSLPASRLDRRTAMVALVVGVGTAFRDMLLVIADFRQRVLP